MAGQFISPAGDLERMFVDDYEMIDQYAKTGSLWLWGGTNTNGQLGVNANGNPRRSSPVQTISGGTNWKSVALASSQNVHQAAIKTDGTLWLWGGIGVGELGNNAQTSRSSPVQTVSGGTNWKQVTVGYFSTAALKTDGTLWTWGYNVDGQLGNNTTASKSSPIQTISGGTNWKQVSLGNYHIGAIKTDGTLWMWGNGNGQGSLGSSNNLVSSPIQTVSSGTNWKSVSCGANVTGAIKTDGTLWTWGSNGSGELGDNTITNRSSPVQTVAAGNNWKQVSMSQSCCSAIKTDGTLWSWGTGDAGSLGDNTILAKSSPVQTVSGGTNWKQVARGWKGAVAIKTDGTLWTWGNNSTGQLGNSTGGASTDKSSPVQTVAGGTNWKQVSSSGPDLQAAIYFYDAGNLYPSA